MMRLEVMDHKTIGKDKLIGQTDVSVCDIALLIRYPLTPI